MWIQLYPRELRRHSMASKYKIVMVDSILPLTDIERSIAASIGCEIEQYNVFEPEDILKVAGDADAIMTVGGHFRAEAIEPLEKCRIIARYGAGFDNVDTEAATKKGIVVSYVPIYCQKEVATLAVTLLLACERKLFQADKATKTGHWVDATQVVTGAHSIEGRTFGLIGFGGIARETVPMMQAFGAKVICSDPWADKELAEKMGVELVDQDTLFKRADYIDIHVPLTPKTKHMIDKAELDAMKKGVIIINTGRGALINQAELTKALQDGRVAAAGLDVLEGEPPNVEDEIFKLDNVITSGHIGACTAEAVERLRTCVATNVVKVLSGEKPLACANPEVLEKLDLK